MWKTGGGEYSLDGATVSWLSPVEAVGPQPPVSVLGLSAATCRRRQRPAAPWPGPSRDAVTYFGWSDGTTAVVTAASHST